MNDIERAIAVEVLEKLSDREIGLRKGHKQILKEVIKDVEKQIPKKPIDDSVMDETFWGQEPFIRKIKVCPSCRNIYLRNKQEYCDKCGQAISWED